MKTLLVLLLLSIVLSGCSGAVRLQRFEVVPSEGWLVADKWRTYQCGQSSLSVAKLRTTRVIIIGPVVPILPVRNENDGNFKVWVEGSNVCPVLVQKSNIVKALEGEPGKTACLYDHSQLSILKPFELQMDSAANQCTTNPISYDEETDWSYCLMCSR